MNSSNKTTTNNKRLPLAQLLGIQAHNNINVTPSASKI